MLQTSQLESYIAYRGAHCLVELHKRFTSASYPASTSLLPAGDRSMSAVQVEMQASSGLVIAEDSVECTVVMR